MPSQEDLMSCMLRRLRFGPSASTSCTCKMPVNKADLVPSESDETLLSIYKRISSLSQFPFVVIRPRTIGKRITRNSRPFLLKVVRMVASVRHLRSMRGQGRAVFKYICDAMLMRSSSARPSPRHLALLGTINAVNLCRYNLAHL